MVTAVFTCTACWTLFGGSYGGRGQVGEGDANMKVVRQRYIQISPNQPTVGQNMKIDII